MRAILQSWFGAVRGGVNPREVALAVFLGTVAGLTLGWNLTFVCVLLLVLLLRAPIKIVIEAAVLGCALGWAFTPTVFSAGHYLLHRTAVGEWLAPRADSLWVVLFDLDRYTLMGGLAIGIVLGLVLGGAAARLTTWMQHRFASLKEKVQAHEAWKQKLWVRLCTWLLFGTPERAKQSPPVTRLIRVSGVVVCLVLLVPLAAAGWFFIPRLSEKAILYGMSVANGAEVNADEVKLSLTDGMLYMKNVQIADPDDLYQDRLRIAHLNAVVNPGLLLRGNVEIEQVLLEGFAADLPRAHRAEPYRPELPGFDKAAGRLKLPTVEALKEVSLKDVLKEGKDLNSRLELAQKIIAKLEELTGGEDRERQKGSRPYYLALRDAHCDFGNPRPKFAICDLRAADPAPEWGLGRSMSIQVQNLSSDPKRFGKATSVELIDPEASLVIAAEFDLHRKNGKHSMTLEMRDREINSLLGEQALGKSLAVQSGRMTVLGEGSVNSREVDVTLAMAVRDVQLAAVGDGNLAGLPAETWSRGLSHVRDFQVVGRIYGPTQAPHVKIDAEKLADEVKSHLGEIGEAALANAAQKHLDVNETEAEDLIAEAKRAAEALKTEEGREGLRTARKLDDIVPGIAAQIREELDRPRNEQVPAATQGSTPPAEALPPQEPRRNERRKRDRYTDGGFSDAGQAADPFSAPPQTAQQETPEALPQDSTVQQDAALLQDVAGQDSAESEQPIDRYTQATAPPIVESSAPTAETTASGSPATDDVVWQSTPPPSPYERHGNQESQIEASTGAADSQPPSVAASESPQTVAEKRGPSETAALPPVGDYRQPVAPSVAPADDVAVSGGGYVRRMEASPNSTAAPARSQTPDRVAARSQIQSSGQRYVHERTIGQRYADRYRHAGVTSSPAPSAQARGAVASSTDEIIDVPPTYRGQSQAGPATAIAESTAPRVGDRYTTPRQNQFAQQQIPNQGGQFAGPPAGMASVGGAQPGPPPVYSTARTANANQVGGTFPPAPPIGRRNEPPTVNPLGPPPSQAARTQPQQNPYAQHPPVGSQAPAAQPPAAQPPAAQPAGQYARQPAPSTAPSQPPADEWRLARWTRTAGTTMKGWFTSEEEATELVPETPVQPARPVQQSPVQQQPNQQPPVQQQSAQPQMRVASQPPGAAQGNVANRATPNNATQGSAPQGNAPANSATAQPAERQSFLQRMGIVD